MGTDLSQHRASLHLENVNLAPWGLEAVGWEVEDERHPVILVPGHFCPRNFWFPSSRNGFGDWLFEHGYAPVALTDTQSPSPATKKRRTSDWVFHILPRLITHLKQTRGRSPTLIGYSAGGAYALACLHILRSEINLAGLAIVGTQVDCHQEPPLTRRALRFLGQARASIQGRWLGFPASINSAAELSEYVDIKAGDGSGHNPIAVLRSQTVIEVDVPVLCVASNADRVAPLSGCKMLYDRIQSTSKEFTEVGNERTGTAIKHFELFARKHKASIWPHLLDWLQRTAD